MEDHRIKAARHPAGTHRHGPGIPDISNKSRKPPSFRIAILIGCSAIIVAAGMASAQTSAGKIMPLGDSITLGFNGINYPNGSIPGGYRRQLGNRLAVAGKTFDFVGNTAANAAPGMDPDHNGYGGIRTDQVLANLPAWLAANPDIVLMHLGTNDLIQHVPLATAVANLSSLIQQITVNAPNRKLFVATIIPIIDTRDGYTAAQWVGVIAAYNAQVRNLVAQYAGQGRKVMLVEMNANLTYTAPNPINNFFQTGDGTHPGQAGYNQMGDFWANAIIASGLPVTPPPVTGSQLLVNGSFEANETGWSRSGNILVQPSGAYAATDGTKLVAFNGGNLAPDGVIAQTFPTTAGATCTLSFDAGVLAYNTDPQQMQVTAAGSSQVLSEIIPLIGAGGGTTRWTRRTFTFVANGPATTLTFRDRSTATNGIDLLLDNVSVTGPPPASGANTAPVAAADTGSTPRDTTLRVATPGVLTNDTDAQFNPLSAVLNTPPGHGSLVLNSNGGFSYTPASGYAGTDSFTYHANDGSLDSNTAVVNITVNAADAGALVNGSFESGSTGWTTTGNQSIASALPYVASTGTKLTAFNSGNAVPDGMLSQSFATIAGQTYALAFDAGVLAFNTNSQTLQVVATGNAALLSRTLVINGSGGGQTRWFPQSFSFTADSATTTLTFRDQSSTTIAIDLLLDNVSVSSNTPQGVAAAAVDGGTPEPGTPTITHAAGTITLQMTASVSGVYFMERSEDLVCWEQVGADQSLEAGPVQFQDPGTLTDAIVPHSRMFYRIGLRPTESEN